METLNSAASTEITEPLRSVSLLQASPDAPMVADDTDLMMLVMTSSTYVDGLGSYNDSTLAAGDVTDRVTALKNKKP